MAGRYRGVTKRGTGWQISFTLPDGTRCREMLRLPQTRKGEYEAFQIRARLLAEVDRGTLDYAAWFPRSSRAIKYCQNPGRYSKVEDLLRKYLVRKRELVAYSTFYNYQTRVYRHLLPEFGQKSVDSLTAESIRDWCHSLDLSGKSINNILIPLREVLADAYQTGLIDKNPMDRVPPFPVTRREARPFRTEEVARILIALNRMSPEVRCYFQLAFSTGLRTSEQIALEWDDIDLCEGKVFVNKAVVRGRLKEPKTLSGKRAIDINSVARSALLKLAQIRHTGPLFINPNTGESWRSGQTLRKKYWYPALRFSNVTQRNPYQTRHTFASHLLSNGLNPMYVAQQMGHSDWGMIRQTYGRWIS